MMDKATRRNGTYSYAEGSGAIDMRVHGGRTAGAAHMRGICRAGRCLHHYRLVLLAEANFLLVKAVHPQARHFGLHLKFVAIAEDAVYELQLLDLAKDESADFLPPRAVLHLFVDEGVICRVTESCYGEWS